MLDGDVVIVGLGIAGACAALADLSLGQALYHYQTLGGLKVDADARVIAEDGAAIAGLYAAGSCAATIVQTTKGYGSGMTLSSGSLFGRVAGRNAAREGQGVIAVA